MTSGWNHWKCSDYHGWVRLSLNNGPKLASGHPNSTKIARKYSQHWENLSQTLLVNFKFFPISCQNSYSNTYSNSFIWKNPGSYLNCDLNKIKIWAFQWKMRFNHHPNEQADEVYFYNESKPDNFLYTLTTILFSYVNLRNILALDKQLNFNVQSNLFKRPHQQEDHSSKMTNAESTQANSHPIVAV